MIVNLNELRLSGEPLLVKGSFCEDDLHIQSRLAALSEDVATELKVSLSGDRVSVKGTLRTALSVTCCRCANPFSVQIAKQFDLEYWPDPDVADGDELELEYEDLEVGFYRDDQIDLSAVLSEQVVIEIPMKPVCREGCKGLCDQCGRDLNEGDCDCDRTKIDPRFAVLAQLKNPKVN